MKHAHFSILYNELPFLKQKLPFLYENFNQLIFYDLKAFGDERKYSSDGSHEYIKNFPDPEDKITLIERKNLHDVKPLGVSNIIKRKMFSLGSEYVKDNIDVFWCTDMDEFFTKDLILEVEDIFRKNQNVNSIEAEHFIFWKNYDIILAESINKMSMPFLTRIARHKKGNKYGHCNIKEKYPQNVKSNNKIYHFAFIGEQRTRSKLFEFYDGTRKNYEKIWDKNYDNIVSKDKLYGYPNMHPNPSLKRGIMKYPYNIKKELNYIDFETFKKDFNLC